MTQVSPAGTNDATRYGASGPSVDNTTCLPATPDAPPDWSTVKEEISCPLCEYSLRGLVESRCPECGYRFIWREMLDPSVRLHPYLFEHHPERNLWSLRKTFVGSLRPKRFWNSIHPVQPSMPKRLVRYWALIALSFVLLLILESSLMTFAMRARHIQARANNLAFISANPGWQASIIRQYGSNEVFLDRFFPIDAQYLSKYWSDYFRSQVPATIGVAMIPWVTLLSLLVFRISMRRARIRTIHVIRAVIYSQTVMLGCFFIARLAGSSILIAFPRAFINMPWLITASSGLFVLIGLIAGFYGMVVAYRDYLRFDRPAWTVLAASAVTVMILINVGLVYNNWQ